jgi:PKD repeat protein
MKVLFTLLASFLFVQSYHSQSVPNFSGTPLTICAGQSVTFTDLSSGTITEWTWDFGDGSSFSSTQHPVHQYNTPGTYNVTLTVTAGTSFSEVKNAYVVVNPIPVVSFTTPAIACEIPYTPVFTNVSPNTGHSYSWTFGNTQTSTEMNPVGIAYENTGTYTVNLTATNTTSGCQNSYSQNINVFNYSADFTTTSNEYCEGQTVTFTNASTAGTNSWNWNFGNSATSISQNPSTTYNTAGTYTVTLTAQNTTAGCSDVATQEIIIHPRPVPSFTASPVGGCSPLTVNFTNTSTPLEGTYAWNFGNATTSTDQDPTVVYNNVGQYSITLTQTDDNGCVGTTTLPNHINVAPLIADYTADIREGCADLDVQFTDASISPSPTDDPIVTWLWDFGNGNTSTDQVPPLQTYPAEKYTVTLTVTTASGCTQTIENIDYITVGIPSTVMFSWTPLTDCAKSDFDFTDESIINDGNPYDDGDVTWEWSFGDGGTAQDQHPTYDFPIDTGYFFAELIVDFLGCRDTLNIEDAVYIMAPISLFNTNNVTVFCDVDVLPFEVNVIDEAILGEVTDDVEMIWRWGNSEGDQTIFDANYLFNSGQQGTTSHFYQNLGSYEIKQVVYNRTTGCEDSTTIVIHLNNMQANFTLASDSVCRGDVVTVTNASTSSHAITSYIYNMGNGQILNGANHNYTYVGAGAVPTSGSYSVLLTVTSSFGSAGSCQSTHTLPVVVLQEPFAQITPSVTGGCFPLDVEFTNASVVQGNGTPLDVFNWTFTDNSTEQTTDISETTDFTFTANGSFQTTLVAVDEFGCESNPATVTTVITQPTADFSVPPVVCDLTTFIATNTSLNYTSSQWFIDNESVGTSANYTGQYDDNNTTEDLSTSFDLTLIVTDANGCTDELTTTVIVSLPQAGFNYNFSGANQAADGTFVCPTVWATLNDNSQSVGDIEEWAWDFGNGIVSINENANGSYVFAGIYTATLTITDEYGCVADTVATDYLTIGGPSGEVNWLNLGDFCNPDFVFTPSNLQNVTSIVWDLGNGETESNINEFNYVYPTQGSYSPTATLLDDFNCAITYEMPTLSVVSAPVIANFTISPTTLPIYESSSIIDFSSGGVNGITNWNWWFGEDNIQSTEGGNFDYTWNTPGQHVVLLTVTDNLGCPDTMSVVVTVTADLLITNVLTTSTEGVGDGVNDWFRLAYPSFERFDIVILNRWGNVVHEAFDQTGVNLWNGTNKGGKMCTDGVYFYKIEGVLYSSEDGEKSQYHGFVTLIVD